MSNNADAQPLRRFSEDEKHEIEEDLKTFAAPELRNLNDVDVWALVDRNHQPVEEWQPNEPPKVVCHMCGEVYPCQTRKDLREAQHARELREWARYMRPWQDTHRPITDIVTVPPLPTTRRRRWWWCR